MFRQYQFKRYDFLLAIIVIGLIIFGIIAIGSATGDNDRVNKQIFGLVFGIITMIIVSLIDYHLIAKFYWVIYIFNLLLLLVVLLFGTKGMGATRWIDLGFTNVQPSEFNKIIMTIFIAMFISKNKDRINHPVIILELIILVAIPMILIFQQPDLSTSLVLVFMLLLMLFVGGLSYKVIIPSIAFVIPLLLFLFWYIHQPYQKLLKPYQLNRILAIENPEQYQTDEFWQQYYSFQAIGSGKLLGKGLNNSMATSVKNTNFLKETDTDFIFSVIGEELGFVGVSALIGTIYLIIIKCILIAKDTKDLLGNLIIIGIVSILVMQTFVNIGVAIAILPNTGIPLPFISYGLSSLLSNMIGIGLILNISMQRKGLIKRG